MKILVPFGHNELGGSQLSWLRLADALADEAFTFVCWAFEPGPLAEACAARKIPYAQLPRSWTRTPWGLVRLARRIRREKPEVIYLHASRMIALVARLLGVPCIERINMSRVPGAGGWARFARIDRLCTNLNTRVLAVSQAIKDQLVARGVHEHKIVVIRNFVDAERFNRPDLRAPARRELGIPEDAIVVLNVGRLVPEKAQSDFLQVAARCLPVNGRLHFLLVGDGPLRDDLAREANELSLSSTGRFQMLPFDPEIERLYAAGDILLHTAHREALANVLLEAMAAGLAIVATDVGGTREVAETDDAALVFPAHDVPSAVALVLEASANPDGQRVETEGRRALKERFCRATHVRSFQALLRSGMDGL